MFPPTSAGSPAARSSRWLYSTYGARHSLNATSVSPSSPHWCALGRRRCGPALWRASGASSRSASSRRFIVLWFLVFIDVYLIDIQRLFVLVGVVVLIAVLIVSAPSAPPKPGK